MKIEENVSIKEFTTFRVGGRVKYFTKLSSKENISEIMKFAREKSLPIFILGGGSNIIVADGNLDMLVIKNEILGREILNESDEETLISVGAGENWDEFVAFCVKHGFVGIEALSAIPGTVGGAPIQNIGAYGCEVKDVIDSVLVYDIEAQDFKTFSNKDCDFKYRDSIFKKFPGKYLVLEVVFRLHKNIPVKIPDYPGVSEKLETLEITNPNLVDIRRVITEIRSNKLPDPKIIPNVGSFFKNPIVSPEVFETLKSKFPNLKYFEVGKNFKIPAGWLIETAGLKGVTFGNVGTYKNNAMVLVNKGGANMDNVLIAQEKIITEVKKIFGIELEREPILIK